MKIGMLAFTWAAVVASAAAETFLTPTFSVLDQQQASLMEAGTELRTLTSVELPRTQEDELSSSRSRTSQAESIRQCMYLFVALCFMYALKGLGHPESSRRGNFAGALGMATAVTMALASPEFVSNGDAASWMRAGICLVIAAVAGIAVAMRAEMIVMPQMVAGFHAMVGLAACLVAYARYFSTEPMKMGHLAETMIGIFFGALTFTGSIIACGKLHGSIGSNPLILPGRHLLNALIVIGSVVLTVLFCLAGRSQNGNIYLYVETGLSLFLGFHLVMSIGGADMPVVVSMLNSYSGWTTVAAGFMLDNDLLIIAGSIIGSSGAILSYIMCANMNRSFISVIAGGFGVEEGTIAASEGGEHSETGSLEVAEDLAAAKSVVIVPGYGMAVARCQGHVASITTMLRNAGVKVRFAIHPVAGRLPGHMNVLLAEANVPYTIVEEMDKINDDFPTTDLVIVCGANDIVNPMAEEEPNCPIGGMPVLQVWKAKKCVVMKRSMATGYAGVDNPLFYKSNVSMLFGNANARTQEIMGELTKLVSNRTRVAQTAKACDDVATEMQHRAKKEYPTPVKTIGVVSEDSIDGEHRVALAPNAVDQFRTMGFRVVVQKGAGASASFPDHYYELEGCQMMETQADVLKVADVVVFVGRIDHKAFLQMPFNKGTVVVGYFAPMRNGDFLKEAASKGLITFSMDAVPRSTVAQKMDALSSMANLAGYKAVIEAFHLLPRFSKPLTTAAGSVPAAKVFVIGAGVAGLSAIGTARSLGAHVKANDTRPVVKEQVESMGAEFVEVAVKEDGAGSGGYAKEMSDEFQKAQMTLYNKCIAEADIVITTAAIPGRDAPKLVKAEAVRKMKAGSVVVDLAALFGGNCDLTKRDEVVTDAQSGVRIVGYTNMPAQMAAQASELYAANLGHLFKHAGGAAKLDDSLASPDDCLGPAICTRGGEVTFKPPQPAAPAPAPKATAAPKERIAVAPVEAPSPTMVWAQFGATLLLLFSGLLGLGMIADPKQVQHVMAFFMAIVIGYFLVWSVDAALHTPLMSATNAISGIIILGAVVQLHGEIGVSTVCAIIATAASAVNIFGGFLITHRMLKMFVKA